MGVEAANVAPLDRGENGLLSSGRAVLGLAGYKGLVGFNDGVGATECPATSGPNPCLANAVTMNQAVL